MMTKRIEGGQLRPGQHFSGDTHLHRCSKAWADTGHKVVILFFFGEGYKISSFFPKDTYYVLANS